jgi:hypothetical protein
MRGSLASAAACAALLLQGCAATLPVPIKPVDCKFDEAALALQCAAPRPLEPLPGDAAVTFGAVIDIGRDDRQALRECQKHLKLAQDMLRECRATMQAYGKEIDRIQGALEAQRR